MCMVFVLFVYEISRGTPERVCAKFITKTCLVHPLDELEGQRSKVKVMRDKKRHFRPSAASVRFMFRKTSLASGFFREKACMQYFCDFTTISRKKSTDFVNTNRLWTECIF